MKYFKIQATRNAARYKIDNKIFDNVTQRKLPFEQRNSQGKLSQYAICPSCLNSIQLIGLSHEIKVSPHGKHTGKNIAGLPQWNAQRYKYCPFASHKEYQKPNDEELLQEVDQSVIELYDLMRSQFDKVVYVIQNTLHIKCSDNFWANALQSYIINRVYLYPWLSEVNLPYIFAYRGMQHMRCFGQQFEIDSEIYNALAKLKNVKFEKTNINSQYAILRNSYGCYLNLLFRFSDHQQNAVCGEQLIETMMFCVDDADNGKTVFEQKISFDETYFMNTVRSKRAVHYRNNRLLDIAAEKMLPLL